MITSPSGVPGAASVSSTRIPAWSVPIASSSSARIIPLETIPRSFAAPSFVPSGITAPGRATATVWPAATFGAPQTICCGSPSPTSTHADAQPVGVRVLLGAEHVADDEVRAAGADAVVVDAVDLGAGHREARRELAHAEVGVHVVVKPGEREPHPNCLRKRRSLS